MQLRAFGVAFLVAAWPGVSGPPITHTATTT